MPIAKKHTPTNARQLYRLRKSRLKINASNIAHNGHSNTELR